MHFDGLLLLVGVFYESEHAQCPCKFCCSLCGAVASGGAAAEADNKFVPLKWIHAKCSWELTYFGDDGAYHIFAKGFGVQRTWPDGTVKSSDEFLAGKALQKKKAQTNCNKLDKSDAARFEIES